MQAQTAKKPRPRTYARNRAFSRSGREKIFESDGVYLLKLITVILVGSFWLRFETPLVWNGWYLTAIPLGLMIGLFLVSKFEHFQSNRKIWYALLIVIAIISLFYPTGIMV